jgi:hypothetical protein
VSLGKTGMEVFEIAPMLAGFRAEPDQCVEKLLNDGRTAREFLNDLVAKADAHQCVEQGRCELGSRLGEGAERSGGDSDQSGVSAIVELLEHERQGRLGK